MKQASETRDVVASVATMPNWYLFISDVEKIPN